MSSKKEFSQYVNDSLNSLVQGKIDIDLDTGKFENQSERKCINSLVKLQNRFKDIIEQNICLAHGNYSNNLKPSGKKDQLWNSYKELSEKRNSLFNQMEQVLGGDYRIEFEPLNNDDQITSLIKHILDNFTYINYRIGKISQGDCRDDIAPLSEHDDLGMALDRLTRGLREVSKAAETVAKGDLKTSVALKGKHDLLGRSINKMITSLNNLSERTEEEKWLKVGQTELSDAMRGEQDIAVLSKNIISYITKYLGAHVGVIYTQSDNTDIFNLTGSYAYTHRKHSSMEIKIGEGIIGQAVLEKEVMVISDLPDSYISVASGTGEAVANCILVAPLMMDDEVKAVIELANFGEFSRESVEFIKLVSENIAIVINSSQDRDKKEALFQESQRHEEELEAAYTEMEKQTQVLKQSEEEMQVQSEELQQTNEELEEKTGYLERQKSEIEVKNEKLELTSQTLDRKARELQITNKYKSEFLANMSHELRTPLNSLMILAKLLADNANGNLTDDDVESADIILSNGRDLIDLINEILDLSKVEAGKLELQLEDIEISSLVEELQSKFTHVAKEKNLELNISAAAGLPSVISIDPQRVKQILKNLLSNAFKFTHEGSVSLDIKRPITSGIDALSAEKILIFTVTDTGIGISEEKQMAIFEAFQQEDGATTRKYGGTGLGLTISRELAHLMGGRIELESTPGKGSKFTLYIQINEAGQVLNEPIAIKNKINDRNKVNKIDSDTNNDLNESSENEVINEDLAIIPFKSKAQLEEAAQVKSLDDDRDDIQEGEKSILIIEDDRNFTKSMMMLAHNNQYKCLAALDGQSGIALAAKYKPSGIILDLSLPDMDGDSVLGYLKHNQTTRHIPIHILSAQNMMLDVINQGAIGYVTKPASKEDVDDIFNKIENINSRKVKNVLVIEDDKNNRKAIIKLLDMDEVKIDAIGTGKETTEKLKSKKYDCVILDLTLPDISGFDLLQQIHDDDTIEAPPIIIYTGKELTKEENTELLQYAESIVVKGAESPERLLDEVALFLHRIESDLPIEQKNIVRSIHDAEKTFKGKHILVVDDDLRNTFALSKVLKQNGLNVSLADNGQMALNKLDEIEGIDLVMMDIMMPIMDGYETMQKIREQLRYKNLPIIALTAKAMTEDRAKCINAGANDYIAKPLENSVLLSMIRVWLSK